MKRWPFDEPYPMRLAWATSDITIAAGVALDLTAFDLLKSHPMLTMATSKLRWGHNHLMALETNVTEAFAGTDYHARLSVHREGEGGDHVFQIIEVPGLDDFAEDIGNSVFDVAGNYRAALDKLAWKLVLSAHGGTAPDPSGVKFPIANTTQDWSNATRAVRQFDQAHSAFVERFQPYHRMNGFADSWHGSYIHPLSMLQSLSNEGKHRDDWPVILPAANVLVSRRAFPDDFDKYVGMAGSLQPQGIANPSDAMEVGKEVMRLRLHPTADERIEDAGRLGPVIAFAEGRPIIDTLQRMERYVHFLLSECARQFP